MDHKKQEQQRVQVVTESRIHVWIVDGREQLFGGRERDLAGPVVRNCALTRGIAPARER